MHELSGNLIQWKRYNEKRYCQKGYTSSWKQMETVKG